MLTATMSAVPDISTDVGRRVIEKYLDEYDTSSLDAMLRAAGAPLPDEAGEKRFRVRQLLGELNSMESISASPVTFRPSLQDATPCAHL